MTTRVRISLQAMTVSVAFAVAAGGCGKPPEETPTAAHAITLGALMSKTGIVGNSSWPSAIQLGVDEMNKGLVTAKSSVKFDLALLDTKSDPAVAAAKAPGLVTTDKAKMIVIDISQNCLAVAKLMYDPDPSKRLEVPITCTAATSTAFNNPQAVSMDALTQETFRDRDDWVFRTVMSSKLQARALVQTMLLSGVKGDVNGDGKFKVSMWAGGEPFGIGFAADMKAAVDLLAPGGIVEFISFNPAADALSYSYGADLAKLTDGATGGTSDAVPDALFEAAFPGHVVGMIKAYAQSGSTIPFFHSHVFRGGLLLFGALGDQINGHQGTSYVGSPDTAFPGAFKTAIGHDAAFFDAAAYDAAVTFMLATLVATKGMNDPTTVTGAQIRTAMRQINVATGEKVGTGADEFARAAKLISEGKAIDYTGASGPVDFDVQGDVLHRIAQWRVENRAFTDVRTFNCIVNDSCPEM